MVRYAERSGGDTMVHEHRAHRFRSTAGSLAFLRVSQVRGPLPGRRSPAKLFLLGPVLGHGFRPTNVPGKSSRHRSLSTVHDTQTVPHRMARQSGAFNAGRCQRVSRLAYLRRFCPGIDRHRSSALCTRSHRRRSGSQLVRAGLHHHRSVSVAVPLGAISAEQSRRQDAHAAGPARQHSHLHPSRQATCTT